MQPANRDLGDQETFRVGPMETGGVVQAGIPALPRSQFDRQVELIAGHGADTDVGHGRKAPSLGKGAILAD